MPNKKKHNGDNDDVSISKSLLPGYCGKGNVEVQITYNFILELYERSKKLKGQEKEEMLTTINELTKHVGKWLVS